MDHDSPTAGLSRRTLFGDLCDPSTFCCSAHFPSPPSGRIKRSDDGFKFDPV